VFEAVDTQHDWSAVISSSYDVLFESSASLLGGDQTNGLPPNWIGLTQDGSLVPLEVDGEDTTAYGYDAARAFWRVAMDLEWSGDGRARAFLEQAGFLRDQMEIKGYVNAVYAHDGKPIAEAASTVGVAGALAALSQLDPPSAESMYAGQILGGANRIGPSVSWGDPLDLYSQEWGWFATAMYARAMPNLWSAR